ncbi:hypothetical protein TELCIR_15093 [Teladorsagia circumcincta]|uniref:Uncharacterized protein n=1 Tax=Teladorsagia circumcincta TaxID=45464 RepID=A0A2G9TZE9_TELCI|nr:hypothetical protein TELCIR_15093 [Teladorsagia circumcincta]
MYYNRRSAVEFPLPPPPLLYQRRPLTDDAVNRRRAVAVSLLWYAPPYPVITPSTQSEIGLHQSNGENLPGYVEKVLEWFRKNDEYNRRIERPERN